jgi:hypothetical protein
MSGENIEYKERIEQLHEFISTAIKCDTKDEGLSKFIKGMQFAVNHIESKASTELGEEE